ncbi:MAG: hypothetical protein A2W90_00205 [Bacteroidetes bacterium GWF2_42_66]|nr:MAG: hypothetical protein A2W89_07380 [Bacteroidetes bacterium GWE2_42_39]OFY44151.1 MAG: hypothetical protein A2W90_00205 [Bacteroidetes bacterium GWF2_42_66]HBL74604.1 hypothetical protein [Prolixibacteraceae bacterium]HCU60888.1 hypothetical protein [Prolixibacteraceae bacterium]
MNSSRATLAIYGIQDRFDYEHPFYVHDHNLCIMQNGRVREFLQLERITRRKRDNQLHEKLYSILKEKKLLAEEFDLVFVDNVVGRTFLTSRGDVRFEAPLSAGLSNDLEEGRCWWFGRETRGWALNHELAHIFSCLPFFGNFKENSLLVHFDGGASRSNFSAWIFRNNQLQLLEYHWELRKMSSIFNANALVFAIIGARLEEQNSVPGKMMGLAGHGSYRSELEKWLIEHDFFENIWNRKSVFFQEAKKAFGIELKYFDQKNPFIQDVVATLHQIFVNEMLSVFRRLKEQTGCEELYYTGGCALNIVANTELVNSGLFSEVYIPPCTEDSGLALGAAAFAEWKKHGKAELHSPYLNGWKLENETFSYSEDDVKNCAEALVAGKTIGICNGFGEAGPRALGNRSLLCLAGSKKLARKISMQHKGREWYRPVAPVMLEKNSRYFTGLDNIYPLSKYMLLDFAVLPEKQTELAGAVHADGTARIQTLFARTDNPYLWDLLTYLDEHHQVKALINTSFNAKGEPIVHSADDACHSAQIMGIDGVVINGQMK